MTLDHILAKKNKNITLASSSTVKGVKTIKSLTGIPGGAQGTLSMNAKWVMPKSGVRRKN
jgi:hypothetical protein